MYIIKQWLIKYYKRYQVPQTRTDGLNNLAKSFSISIDDSRLDDYIISEFNTEIPSITIQDLVQKIEYHAEYNAKCDLGHIIRIFPSTNWLKVITKTAEYEIVKFYRYIEGESKNFYPEYEKITFRNGKKQLTILRENRPDIMYNYYIVESMRVTYDIFLEENDIVPCPLFTKIYKILEDEDGKRNGYTHMYTYDFNYDPRLKRGNEYETVTYYNGSNIAYDIEDRIIKDKNGLWTFNISGFCIESLLHYGWDNLPLSHNMNLLNGDNCPELFNHKTRSAMYFKGANRENDTSYILEIYKNITGIHIKYSFKICREQINVETYIPCLSAGTISIEEIDSIISYLEEKYGETEFIKTVVLELAIFRKKMCTNKGFNTLDEDQLSPQVMINLTMEKIAESILSNQNDCIDLIEKQFEKWRNIDANVNEKEKSFYMKTLRKNN